ncbi:MAG: hypothetical protein KFKLKKLM_00700 [Flavobacteriales bacterium]|nr:hypothetical protein [Flavobacteriales bacterium]
MENKEEFKLSYFDSVSIINADDWNSVNKNQNIYLTLEYLLAIETALKNEMKFRYILFYNHNNIPVGIAIVQLVKFIDKGSPYYAHLCKLTGQLKNKIVQSLNIKVMVCGNVFSCGENGFLFSNEIPYNLAYENLHKALQRLRKAEKTNDQTSIVLLKEFWPATFEKIDLFKEHNYRDFMIDVNMVLPIHKNWNTIDDYLSSMVAKFRTRVNSMMKKSAPLVVKNMELNDIVEHSSKIVELYTNVLNKSDITLGTLNEQAFIQLKQHLGNQFVLNGYFLNNKLIAFSSAFWTKNILDANYVGIDYEYNIEYATYQRMLYDFVVLALNKKATEIRYGRTAEEIKSCLGAQPVNMKLFIKHKNSVSNKLLKPLIKSITPTAFEIRKPFKANFI